MFYYRNREIYAVRKGDYKVHYIIQGAYNYPEKTEKIVLDKPLLFNLNSDPSEKFNIAKDNAEILKNIKEIVINHKKDLIFKEDLLKYRSVE